jgi:hypothetical protein
MILIWRGRYSSRADNIQLKQMILIWREQYSSRADDIHPMETLFIQERRISSMMVDSWNNNQLLEMISNHWGSQSTTGDDDQPLSMIIGRNRWYIVCSRWIYHLPQMNLSKNLSRSNYLPRKISNIHFYNNRHKTKLKSTVFKKSALLKSLYRPSVRASVRLLFLSRYSTYRAEIWNISLFICSGQ